MMSAGRWWCTIMTTDDWSGGSGSRTNAPNNNIGICRLVSLGQLSGGGYVEDGERLKCV